MVTRAGHLEGARVGDRPVEGQCRAVPCPRARRSAFRRSASPTRPSGWRRRDPRLAGAASVPTASELSRRNGELADGERGVLDDDRRVAGDAGIDAGAVRARPVLQLPAVFQSVVPAPPVQLSVQLKRRVGCGRDADAGRAGDRSGCRRRPEAGHGGTRDSGRGGGKRVAPRDRMARSHVALPASVRRAAPADSSHAARGPSQSAPSASRHR